MHTKYAVRLAKDHGMDGFIVDTTEEFFTFLDPNDKAIANALFSGQLTLQQVHDNYLESVTQPFYRLITTMLQHFHRESRLNYMKASTFPIVNHLQAIDAANSPEIYADRLVRLLTVFHDNHLRLFVSGLGDKAAMALGELLVRKPVKSNSFFENNPEIEIINLVGNLISQKGCEGLAAGLRACKTLDTLKLSDNPIGDQGLLWITKALKEHPGIKTLELMNCQLTDEGMKHIAALLTENSQLEIIKLNANPAITDNGAASLVNAIIKKHQWIQEIQLDKTGVSKYMLQEITTVLEQPVHSTGEILKG